MPNRTQQHHPRNISPDDRAVRSSSADRLPYESDYDEERTPSFAMEGARRGGSGDDERERAPTLRFERSDDDGKGGDRAPAGRGYGSAEPLRDRYDAGGGSRGGHQSAEDEQAPYDEGVHASSEGPHHPRGYDAHRGHDTAGGYDPYGHAGDEHNRDHSHSVRVGTGFDAGPNGVDRAGVSSTTGRGPKGYTRSDARIREDICDRLCNGRFDCSDVEVSVANGAVTLTGTVFDRQTKYYLEETSDRVGGVRDVHNQIRINRQGGEPQRDSGETDGNGTRSPGPAH